MSQLLKTLGTGKPSHSGEPRERRFRSIAAILMSVPMNWRLLWRGPAQNDPWERPGLIGLLASVACLYLWGLEANGWANPYYSAAAQAGAHDWKAFFFGSVEWGNLITVDKTPLSTWVIALSVRLFGLSSWSILVPQALMGLATTYLVFRITRRAFGPRTALFAAAAYAVTPVVMLMSRFNNPEPLMGLLMVSSVLATLKALESGRSRTFALAGFLLGLAFMAKQVQALLVVPALCVAVLALGQGRFVQRLRQLAVASLPAATTGGAWLVAVDLIPVSLRPYVGGSVNNSAIELTLDYNGLARFVQIPMNSSGSRATASEDVAPLGGGIRRIFNGNFAPEIGWLLFAGIVCCIITMVLSKTLVLTRQQRSLSIVAIVWFATVLALLCFMGTMIHTYYTFALGGPLAFVVAIGLSTLWRLRNRAILKLVGAVLIGASSYMGLRIMNYSHEWPIWFRVAFVIAGLAGTAAWILPARNGKWTLLSLLLIAISLLIGPAGNNIYTLLTPQKGTNPQSGPVGADSTSMSRLMLAIKAGDPAWAQKIALGSPPSPAVIGVLQSGPATRTWAAATYSAQNAALYQLESGLPVIPLGGWLGTDPAPTLDQFKALVAEKRVGYFIWQQDLLERGELSTETKDISNWVRANFTEEVVDGVSLYNLASRAG
ncbi:MULTISPECIES: ArnT family glycosyltransferase [unclassified Pseudarthrobacter]|uniref:ArnT family glycosyltransferase n=1 Tax=unclassified Pseudarthrobacter TaxID=2647000 RepID=UPI00363AC818